jgi:capsular polysaccharide biosynthesis protein
MPTEVGGQGGSRRTRHPMARLAVVCLALLLLPPAVAVAWSFTRPTSYAAQVDLVLVPSAGSSADAINRDLATHQVLVTRQPLVDNVARTVQRDPDDLQRNLTAEVVEQSNVLRLQVVDRDRDRAQRTAQNLALKYTAAADQVAGTSDMSRMQMVGPATLLDQPVGPKPLQAAAAGTLLGLVLLAGLLALLRLRPKDSRHLAS